MTESESIKGQHNLLEFEYFPSRGLCIIRALHSGAYYARIRNLDTSPEVCPFPGIWVSLETLRLAMEFVGQHKADKPANPPVVTDHCHAK
jgi:hypothetical protein